MIHETEMSAARAHQAIEAEDLAGMKLERDVIDDVTAASTRERQVLHTHQDLADFVAGA